MNHHASRLCDAVSRPERPIASEPGVTTMSVTAIRRAFVRFTGRHLARRTSRYLRTIDPRDLDAIVRGAREFAGLMQALRACVHRYWRRVCNARLADARQ